MLARFFAKALRCLGISVYLFLVVFVLFRIIICIIVLIIIKFVIFVL